MDDAQESRKKTCSWEKWRFLCVGGELFAFIVMNFFLFFLLLTWIMKIISNNENYHLNIDNNEMILNLLNNSRLFEAFNYQIHHLSIIFGKMFTNFSKFLQIWQKCLLTILLQLKSLNLSKLSIFMFRINSYTFEVMKFILHN